MTRAQIRHDDPMDSANWPTPETPLTPGWRFVSIGFWSDPVDVRGVDPRTFDWGRTKGWIVVAHPSYPHERHSMFVYELADQTPPLVFAAGEFSNGVWGFFVPEDDDAG